MPHLENNNILYDLQHGFRPSRSCETQLISFLQHFSQSNNQNIQTDVVIMDFAKAFDKVPQQHLLKVSYQGARQNLKMSEEYSGLQSEEGYEIPPERLSK